MSNVTNGGVMDAAEGKDGVCVSVCACVCMCFEGLAPVGLTRPVS